MKKENEAFSKIEAVIEAWRESLQAFDQFSKEIVTNCFFRIQVKIMVQIVQHLEENNRIPRYDKKIFQYFQHLLEQYETSIQLFDQNKEKIHTGKAKKILEGICTVLSSQCKQLKENPIQKQRDELIKEIKRGFIQTFDQMENDYFNQQMRSFQFLNEKALLIEKQEDKEKVYLEMVKNIYKALIIALQDELYQCYLNVTQEGIKRLDEFQLKQGVHFYYDAIKQEKENLEAIIKIQVNALEEEIKIKQYEPIEEQKIQEFLSVIRETYQHLGKEIQQLEQDFKETETTQKEVGLMDESQFMKYMSEQGIKIPHNDVDFVWMEKKEQFLALWNDIDIEDIHTLMGQEDQQQWFEKLLEEVEQQEVMTKKMIMLFMNFQQYYEQQRNILEPAEQFFIIEGIAETIAIKIDSLKENSDCFFKEMNDDVKSLQDVLCVSLSCEEQIQMKQELYQGLLENTMNVSVDDNEGFFLETSSNSMKEQIREIYDSTVRKKIKKRENQKQLVEKKIHRFLKEQVLFEISTYEEIVHYSVSRLREEKEELDVIQYVQAIDRLTVDIQNLLKENEITPIVPSAHERFNGMEHEVLMAEKQEGFTKGEIIKTMNTGYKYKDQLILKANVIAAK